MPVLRIANGNALLDFQAELMSARVSGLHVQSTRIGTLVRWCVGHVIYTKKWGATKFSRIVESTREISTYREEYLTRILQT